MIKIIFWMLFWDCLTKLLGNKFETEIGITTL